MEWELQAYEPVRVALVGIGRWSAVHADSLKKTRKLELVTCNTRSKEKGTKFSRENGCDFSESYDSLLRRDDVEAVILSTPHTTHADLAVEAAEHGKHVLLEKPLANSVLESKRIIDACRQAKVVLAVCHDRRRLQRFRLMKATLERGAMGKVLMAEANFSADGGLSLTPEKWRWYRKESPGGPMMSTGIHHIDTFHYLLGPISEASAFITKLAVSGELDDTVCATFRCQSGVLATLCCTFASPRTFFLNMYGTMANLYNDEKRGLQILRKGSETMEPMPFAEVDPVLIEQDDFADAVRLNRRPEVGGEEAIMNVAVVEAMIKSSEQKRVVSIEEILST